jgi:hypothetical protein
VDRADEPERDDAQPVRAVGHVLRQAEEAERRQRYGGPVTRQGAEKAAHEAGHDDQQLLQAHRLPFRGHHSTLSALSYRENADLMRGSALGGGWGGLLRQERRRSRRVRLWRAGLGCSHSSTLSSPSRAYTLTCVSTNFET